MVCVLEEENALCIFRDMTTSNTGGNQPNKVKLFLPGYMTVQELFEELGRKYQYEPDSFEVILQRTPDGESVVLNEHKDKTIYSVGVSYEPGARNTLILTDMHAPPRRKAPPTSTAPDAGGGEDDMLLGASASPTAAGDYAPRPPAPPLPAAPAVAAVPGGGEYSTYASALANRHDTGYVGLVNQAMTCYLNSLIQALYMTPEFRNALYSWHYEGSDYEESKNIPYQLQKLFLNLQTSDKTAVETTELTRSFGWDSSEAWQQHDIQELCRVMFDALEQTFKNTKQADLILSLYEGKMIDYVKCLECSTEKSREDTFLDIPLPVRPFGSTVAYGSVEEALRAFVQPETLDGNNQYHCDKCAKKCDAHKGLKFSKFPYLLTLHLKRFDFDYSTMHRIKLNDKVMFPETLNLNSFVTSGGEGEEGEAVAEETVVKNDDSSTTDSGSALDDEACQPDSAPGGGGTGEQHPDYPDDDEGIADVTNGHENEKNRIHSLEKGPYSYELFSIMIHSGSASGGHYYAYIKDFREGAWYCFNDQSVSRITYDDIRKTYGGGPMRGYYSGAYSSSTNAYMLMYRQIDGERNRLALTVDELPPHIQVLLRKVQEREETDRMLKEQEMDMCKIKLFAHHPTQKQVVESKLSCHNQSTLAQVTEWAHANLELQGVVPLERCRLVNYDRLQDSIECSFEGRESEPIADILGRLSTNYKYDLLLEIRNENSQFEVYQPGGVATKVFVVDVLTQEVDGPTVVRGNLSQTVGDFKLTLAKALDLNSDTIKVVLEKYSNEPRLLVNNENTLKFEGFYGSNKIFVASMIDVDPDKPFIVSQLHQVIDRFEHILTLHMVLPDTEKDTLDKMSIPTLVATDVNHNGPVATEVPSQPPRDRDPSPQPPDNAEDDGFGAATGHSDQSNSEDSSLTDSDRTIVGDEGPAQLSSPSNSSPGSERQDASSPDDGNNTIAKDELATTENWDEDSATSATVTRSVNYYFKASPYISCDNQKMLKVLVDKRMILGKLKRCLEPHIGVPVEFFKLYRIYTGQQTEVECPRLNESLSSYRDDERLTVKLGRALRKGEHRGKVYQLLPNSSEPIKFLCDWILGKDMTVGEAKREILQELRQKYAIDIPLERCRVRKKSWKNPTKIHLDSDKFDDIGLFANWELFLQELSGPEPVTSANQLVVFVRRWRPSTMELEPFSEVLLYTPTVSELRLKLSALSAIPLENVDFAKPQGSFPCETSVLSIHNDVEWNPTSSALDSWPLNITEDGHVIFYRDSKEELKELTCEERKELANKEGASSNRYYSKATTYSPRKEKALKIYLDTSPKRREPDLEVD